ncbi:MAG: MFS transporter [Candidatus Lokiarchaeota archaeon]|nr:MFS transporter [Candidatus Lokiarchaeota archaeon]
MVENVETTSRHSRWTNISFGTYNILWTIPSATINLFYLFYYEQIVGLEFWQILVIVAINTIWAGLNDPLIGWLTDRNFKWTRKWGRRFPWIVIGFIPLSLSIVMVFSAPDLPKNLEGKLIDPLPAMLWLLASLFVYDLFITLVDIHVSILRSDKFRTETERRKYAGSWGVFDMVAQSVGMIIPPLLVADVLFGELNPLSYTIMAIIMASIMIIFGIIFILKGAREDKIIIDRYYSRDYEPLKIFKGLWLVLKQKSFMALYLHYVLWLSATTIMTGMVVYLTQFVLPGSDMTIFLALFMLGGLVSIPVWLKILKKMNNNKKIYLIGSLILVVLVVALGFFQTDIDFMILMFLMGFGNGAIWSIGMPVLYSNVQDDFVVRNAKNQKGILVGTWAVISLLTAFIDEGLITLVFWLCGSNIELAIRLLIGIVPALVILLGTLIFWKFYPLTQEKVMENKSKLEELGF